MSAPQQLWNEGKYKECLEALRRTRKSSSEPQGKHNLVLAGYLSMNGTTPHQLYASLVALSKDISQQPPSPLTDPAVVTLNMGITLIQQNRFVDAVNLLEPLFEDIEPMQETVAVRICLLLIELYLSLNSFAQAAKVLHYLETAYGVPLEGLEDKESLLGQNSDLELGTDTAQVMPDHADPSCSPSRGPADIVGSHADSMTSPPKSDSISSGVTEEGEIAAVLGRMLDQAGRMDTHPTTQGNCFLEVGGVPIVQLVRVSRARLNLALNQLRLARRDIKAVLAADPTSPQGLSLRAQLELQRQSYRKSARILTLNPSPESSPQAASPRRGSLSPDKAPAQSSLGAAQPSQQQDDVRHVATLNNLGAVQHAQGKHNTAALCCAQALQKCAHRNTHRGEQPFRSGLPHNAELQIAYSAGLQALQLSNYSSALRCFQVATAALHNSPALWLRMADCCMGVLQQPASQADTAAHASQLTALVGQEAWRHAVQPEVVRHDNIDQLSHQGSCMRSIQLAQQASQACRPDGQVDIHNPAETVQQQEGTTPAAHSSLVKFAIQCLHNATVLCDQSLHHSTASASDSQAAQIQETGPQAAQNQENGLPDAGVNPGSKLPYPSNGDRGTAGGPTRSALGRGSAAEAAEQLAMLSFDRSRAASSAMDAAVAAATDSHRQQLHTIKAAALANLAWLYLQQQQWQQAQQTCDVWLQVPGLTQEQQVLALMYTAEALCHMQGTAQAAQQLQKAVVLQRVSSNGTHRPSEDGISSHNNEESPGVSQALQVAVLVNAASLQASQGHLQKAEDFAVGAAQLQPSNQQALLVLIYVELCKGNCSTALNLLKQQHLPVS